MGLSALNLITQDASASLLIVGHPRPLLPLGHEGAVVPPHVVQFRGGTLHLGLEVPGSLLPNDPLRLERGELVSGSVETPAQRVHIPLAGSKLGAEGLAPGPLLLSSRGLDFEDLQALLEPIELLLPGTKRGLLYVQLHAEGLDPAGLNAVLLRFKGLDVGPQPLQPLLLDLALNHHLGQILLLQHKLSVHLLDGLTLPADLVSDLAQERMFLRAAGLKLDEAGLHRDQLTVHFGPRCLGLGLADTGLRQLFFLRTPVSNRLGEKRFLRRGLLSGRSGCGQGDLQGFLLGHGHFMGCLPPRCFAASREADLFLLRCLRHCGLALLLPLHGQTGRGELRLGGGELLLERCLDLLPILPLGFELLLERGLPGRGSLQPQQTGLLGRRLPGQTILLRRYLLLLDLRQAALLRVAFSLELKTPGLLGHGLQLRNEALLVLPGFAGFSEEDLLLLPRVHRDALLLLRPAAGLGLGSRLLLLQAQLLLRQCQLLLLLRQLHLHRGLQLLCPAALLLHRGGLLVRQVCGPLLGPAAFGRCISLDAYCILKRLQAPALVLERGELLLLQLRHALGSLALLLGLGHLGLRHIGQLLRLEALGFGLGFERLDTGLLGRYTEEQLLLVDAGLLGLPFQLLLTLPCATELAQEAALPLNSFLEVLPLPLSSLGLRIRVGPALAVDEDQDVRAPGPDIVGRLALKGHYDPRCLDFALAIGEGPDLGYNPVIHLQGLPDSGDVAARDVHEEPRWIVEPEHAERRSRAPRNRDQGPLGLLLDLDVPEDIPSVPGQGHGGQKQGRQDDEYFDFHSSPRLAAR